MRIGIEIEQASSVMAALRRLGVPSIAIPVNDPHGNYVLVEVPSDTFTKIADTWFGEGKSLTVKHGGLDLAL